MPAVEHVDAELLLTDWLPTVFDECGLTGWTRGTVVKAGVTPTNFVQVRLIGGVDYDRVADRPRLDVRLWGDGMYLSEGSVKASARALLARIRRDHRAVVVMSPTPLPDPADATKTHVMFTIELLTRGVQA